VWPLQNGMSYLGKDGGGGWAQAPASRSARRSRCITISGRYAVSMLGDGDLHGRQRDLERRAASHSALVLINNNRSTSMTSCIRMVWPALATRVKNRWIGLRMEDRFPTSPSLPRRRARLASAR
jgi:hypothetical protein